MVILFSLSTALTGDPTTAFAALICTVKAGPLGVGAMVGGTPVLVAVGATDVLVGGTAVGVAVGGTAVAVGGTPVLVAVGAMVAVSVPVGGTVVLVAVGGTTVAVGATTVGVAVGGAVVLVGEGGTAVLIGVGVAAPACPEIEKLSPHVPTLLTTTASIRVADTVYFTNPLVFTPFVPMILAK